MNGYYYININNKNLLNKLTPSKFIDYTDNGFIILNSYFFNELIKLKPEGYYTIWAHPYRPDNISADIYNGDKSYAYILMYYNNKTHLNQLKQNVVLKYPNLRDLENLYIQCNNLQNSNR